MASPAICVKLKFARLVGEGKCPENTTTPSIRTPGGMSVGHRLRNGSPLSVVPSAAVNWMYPYTGSDSELDPLLRADNSTRVKCEVMRTRRTVRVRDPEVALFCALSTFTPDSSPVT
jgi:hypothetical protein